MSLNFIHTPLRVLSILLILFGLGFWLSRSMSTPAQAAIVPDNFVDELVTSISSPTALGFTPDGRMLITRQTGEIRVFENGTLLPTPAINLKSVNGQRLICIDQERGVLGLAVDPNFAQNQYIYVFYTFDVGNSPADSDRTCPRQAPSPINPVNRVVRFTLPPSNIIDPASQVILVSNIQSNWGHHNAGNLQFGTDGYLYISTGDGGAHSTDSQAVDHINGKILRIKTDGSYPTDNPYANDPNVQRCGDPNGLPAAPRVCGEIFAKGFRNPFRFSIQPETNKLYANDVGQADWEEINEVEAGKDYGWDDQQGPCPYPPLQAEQCGSQPATMTYPLHTYHHDSGCAAITGGAFVPTGAWPAPYSGKYLYADYVCGTIFRLEQVTGYTLAQSGIYLHNQQGVEFVSGLGNSSAVGMIFGPYESTQALYYTNYADGGQIRRIRYTGTANRPPEAILAATPTVGTLPLLVNFSAVASSDPDNDPITYDWDFGDGQVLTGSLSATIQHTYTTLGIYTATLIVRDDQGLTSPQVTQRIDVGNTAPVPVISVPAVTDRFTVGQIIELQGSATDANEGTLADDKLTWQVTQFHFNSQNPENTHSHPYMPPITGNNLSVIAPDMEDIYSNDSYLEIKLTATDSLGASTTITRVWQPSQVDFGVTTHPQGLILRLGRSVAEMSTLTPRTFGVWEGSRIFIDIEAQQPLNNLPYQFISWSNSGNISHTVTVGATPETLSAIFAPIYTPTATPTTLPTTTSTPTNTGAPTNTVTPTSTATSTDAPVSTGTATSTTPSLPTVTFTSTSIPTLTLPASTTAQPPNTLTPTLTPTSTTKPGPSSVPETLTPAPATKTPLPITSTIVPTSVTPTTDTPVPASTTPPSGTVTSGLSKAIYLPLIHR